MSNSSTPWRIRRTRFAGKRDSSDGFLAIRERGLRPRRGPRRSLRRFLEEKRGAVGVSDSMCSGRGPTRKRYTASPEYLWHIRTSSDIYTSGAARNARTAIPNNCFWKCELPSLLTTEPSRFPSSSCWRQSARTELDNTSERLSKVNEDILLSRDDRIAV